MGYRNNTSQTYIKLFGQFTISKYFVPIEFLSLDESGKSVRFDRNKMQFFKNNYNLEFKCKGYLIFPLLSGLYLHCKKLTQITIKIRDLSEMCIVQKPNSVLTGAIELSLK